jgi:hypothetical protein
VQVIWYTKLKLKSRQAVAERLSMHCVTKKGTFIVNRSNIGLMQKISIWGQERVGGILTDQTGGHLRCINGY